MKKVLSLDIGGTNTRLALINDKFEIEQLEIVPTKRNSTQNFLDNIDVLLSHFNIAEVNSIGVGIPGVCDRKLGYIKTMPNAQLKDVPLGEYIFNKYQKHVYMRNDAEMASLAEAYIGKGKDYNRVFFITISTGLGGALVVDKKNQDYVTEIGHTAYCYKGKWTEYEHLASGDYIKDLAKLNGLTIANSQEFFNLIREKDEKALMVYHEWLNVLSDFLTLVVNSYQPDIITVTGGVMKSKDIFFEDLKNLHKEVRIVECGTKENAGLIGGAIYAFQCEKNEK